MKIFLFGELARTNYTKICPAAKIIGDYRLEGSRVLVSVYSGGNEIKFIR